MSQDVIDFPVHSGVSHSDILRYILSKVINHINMPLFETCSVKRCQIG